MILKINIELQAQSYVETDIGSNVLNVLGGNAVSAVTQEGLRVELGPPDYDARLADGWIVELAVGTGRAALVLSPF